MNENSDFTTFFTGRFKLLSIQSYILCKMIKYMRNNLHITVLMAIIFRDISASHSMASVL